MYIHTYTYVHAYINTSHPHLYIQVRAHPRRRLVSQRAPIRSRDAVAHDQHGALRPPRAIGYLGIAKANASNPSRVICSPSLGAGTMGHWLGKEYMNI